MKIDIAFPIEDKVAAMIRSVLATQIAWAKAHLVDRSALASARAEGDVVQAHCVIQDAFETDVRELVALLRSERKAAASPVADYLASDDRAARLAVRTTMPTVDVGRPEVIL